MYINTLIDFVCKRCIYGVRSLHDKQDKQMRKNGEENV